MTDAPSGSGARPGWWLENERLKADLGLPRYEPSRFEDGVYTYTVVDPLEEAYGCDIRFVGVNPIYPDDWVVQIDREPAFPIPRRRDENGNTVFQMSSDEFLREVESALADDD